MAWLTGWQYRALVKIPRGGEELTDYQYNITIPYSSGKMRTDFGDIRFTSDDGETLLDYHLASKTNGVSALFVVKVPNIPESPGNTEIYVYAGNPTATTTSDPESVYLLYDDFESGVIDTGKWDTDGNVSIVTDGTKKVLRLVDGGISSVNDFTENLKVEYGLKFNQIGAYGPRLQCMVRYSEYLYYNFQINRGGGIDANIIENENGTLDTNIDDWSAATWYDLYVRSTNEVIEAQTSSNLLFAYSNNEYSGKIIFYVWDGNTGYLDNIKVRKSPAYPENEPGPANIGSWTEEYGGEEDYSDLLGIICVYSIHNDFKGILTVRAFREDDLRGELYVQPYIKRYKFTDLRGEITITEIGPYKELRGEILVDGIFRKVIPVRGRILRETPQLDPTDPSGDKELDEKMTIMIGDGIYV